mgnify:CR=1 FL=1
MEAAPPAVSPLPLRAALPLGWGGGGGGGAGGGGEGWGASRFTPSETLFPVTW